jgi:SAM-dependent methyltransferase
MRYSLSRSLFSYSKVQRLLGSAIRNSPLQLRAHSIQSKQYLDLGCGWKTHPHMINLDWQWHPEIDLCWDVASKGIPLRDGFLSGIYSEHCLEHHPPQVILFLLAECYRCLRPGGVLRLILPDAQQYITTYQALINGQSHVSFPYPADIAWNGISSPLLGVNRIFYQDRDSPHGHCFMFDNHLLNAFLSRVGFTSIQEKGFREGVDSQLLLDSGERWAESFAMEAQRPDD